MPRKNWKIIALIFVLAACSATHQVENKQINEGAAKIESLVVFGVSPERSERVNFEEAFSDSMTEAGIPTRPTYVALPEIESLEDETAVIEMYRETGANYGLTVEVVKSNEAAKDARGVLFATWVAGALLDSREIRQVGAWGGLGAHAAAGSYKMRLILWDAESAQSVWSADTRSFSIDNAQEDAETLAEFLAKELKSDGFVD